MSKPTLKPLASAIGTTFVVSLAVSPMANANENPFSMTELSGGYMVSQIEESARCGSICGGASPKADKNGEMIKCGNVCGEAAKCGSICGGVSSAGDRPVMEDKDVEAAKCGSICAAMAPADE